MPRPCRATPLCIAFSSYSGRKYNYRLIVISEAQRLLYIPAQSRNILRSRNMFGIPYLFVLSCHCSCMPPIQAVCGAALVIVLAFSGLHYVIKSDKGKGSLFATTRTLYRLLGFVTVCFKIVCPQKCFSCMRVRYCLLYTSPSPRDRG